MLRTELSEAELEYLRSNYGRITIREIAAHLYVSETTAYRLIERYGIEPMYSPKEGSKAASKNYYRWTQGDHEIFLEMAGAGYTYWEIAAVLHRSVASVKAFRKRYHPDCPAPPRQSRIHCMKGKRDE